MSDRNTNESIDVTSAEFRKLSASERIQRLRQRADPYAPSWNWDANAEPRYGEKKTKEKSS